MSSDNDNSQEIQTSHAEATTTSVSIPTSDEEMAKYLSNLASENVLLNFNSPKEEFQKKAEEIDEKYSFTDLVKSIDGVNDVLASIQGKIPIQQPDGKFTALIRRVPGIGNKLADMGKKRPWKIMSAGENIVSLEKKAGESIHLLEQNLEATKRLSTEIEAKLSQVNNRIDVLESFLNTRPQSLHQIRINQQLVNLYTVKEVYRGKLQEISQHIGSINISKDSLTQGYPVLMDQIETGVVSLQSLAITRRVQETQELLKNLGGQMVIGSSRATQEVVMATIELVENPIISLEVLDTAGRIQAETTAMILEAPEKISASYNEILRRFRSNNENYVPVNHMIPDWNRNSNINEKQDPNSSE